MDTNIVNIKIVSLICIKLYAYAYIMLNILSFITLIRLSLYILKETRNSRFCVNPQNRRLMFVFFFLSGFSFTDTDDSQDSRGRKGTIFYSSLPLPPAHEH